MNGEENNILSTRKRRSSLDANNITWPALAALTLSACGGGGGGGQMVLPTPTNRAPVAAADKTVNMDEDAANTALAITAPTDADGNN